jgi:hypothetical protein
MKVWIVTHWMTYEFEEIAGVYATEAAARLAHPMARSALDETPSRASAGWTYAEHEVLE